jgi:hypothetical protein
MYDGELGVKYSALYEEGGYWAWTGGLIDGGVRICTLGTWRCQAVGELAFHRFVEDESTYVQFSGGLRLGGMAGERARPFLQFLVGNQRCCDTSATVYLFGGGVNVAMTDALDLQVQADVPFADYPGGTFNQFRLSVGISAPLTRR